MAQSTMKPQRLLQISLHLSRANPLFLDFIDKMVIQTKQHFMLPKNPARPQINKWSCLGQACNFYAPGAMFLTHDIIQLASLIIHCSSSGF